MRWQSVSASVFFLATSVVFAQRGTPSSIRLRVSNDAGSPVTNAVVDGCFLDVSNSGARDQFNGVTDSNGVFTAKGDTLLGLYARITSNGYYPTTVRQDIVNGPKSDGGGHGYDDRWERDVPVLLKRIRQPIPMCMKQVENPHVNLWEHAGKYLLACVSRYDIVKQAFCPPYGVGDVADLEFTWRVNIYQKDSDGLAVDYDTLCVIRLTNCVDGICHGFPDGAENGQRGSEFISKYEAPLDGYTNAISFYRNVRGAKAESNDYRDYLYYFRVRTQTNELGQVTNAFYGKIYGQINGRFTYYLDPTPNNLNIEVDPRRVLTRPNSQRVSPYNKE